MSEKKYIKLFKLFFAVIISFFVLALAGQADYNTVSAQTCGGSIGGVPLYECATDPSNFCQYCNYVRNQTEGCGCGSGGCRAEFSAAECDDNYNRCVNSGGAETPFCHLFDASYSSRGADSCSGSCSVTPTPTPIPSATSAPGTCWCGVFCGSPSCAERLEADCDDLGVSCAGCTGSCGGGSPSPTPTPLPATGVLLGRVFIDWNENGVPDDDYYGYYGGIQHSNYGCGNYFTSDAFSVGWTDGVSSGTRTVNEIPPGVAGCSPPPYYADSMPVGTYTVTLNKPGTWDVVSFYTDPDDPMNPTNYCYDEDLAAGQATCDIVDGLGTHAWFGVVPPVNCTINWFNSSYSLAVDENRTVYAGATADWPNSYDVSQISFTRGSDLIGVCDPEVADPFPCPETSASHTDTSGGFWGEYLAGMTGYEVGSTTLTATATLNDPNSITCSQTATVNVTPQETGWWSTYGGNAVTVTGNIESSIPSNCSGDCYIINALATPELDEGIAIHGGTIDAGMGEIMLSDPDRDARTTYAGDLTKYTYDFFRRKAPITPTAVDSTNLESSLETVNASGGTGYHWFIYDGATDLETNGILNIGSRKVILFVKNSDFVIRHRIRLANGTGLFMVVAENDIVVERSVGGATTEHLEGIYFAEGNFVTQGLANSDEQLLIRGMIVGIGSGGGEGVDFNRSLPTNAEAAEVVTYGPDLVFNYPRYFSKRSVEWKEVAPE